MIGSAKSYQPEAAEDSVGGPHDGQHVIRPVPAGRMGIEIVEDLPGNTAGHRDHIVLFASGVAFDLSSSEGIGPMGLVGIQQFPPCLRKILPGPLAPAFLSQLR